MLWYIQKELMSMVPLHIFHTISSPGHKIFSQASFPQNNIRVMAKVEREMAGTLTDLEKLLYEYKTDKV